MHKLVQQAHLNTDNKSDVDVSNQKGFWDFFLPDWWSPKGTIKVWDHVIGDYVPVKRCKVRARRWFKIRTDYTSESGYYQTDQFRYKVNYSIKYKAGAFTIMQAPLWGALYNGPKKKGDWNLNIGSSTNESKMQQIATIHRAADRLFYRDTDGLSEPYFGLSPLYINYKHQVGNYLGSNFLINNPIFPSITIYGFDSNGYRKSYEIFNTTSHELGHTIHMEAMNGGLIDYHTVDNIIQESWADAVGWYLTRKEYIELGVDPESYDLNFGYSDWNQTYDIGNYNGQYFQYSPLIIDMIDHYNQSTEVGDVPNDPCPGEPWFDGQSCLVEDAPSGTSAFIYNDNFYYTPIGCCDCPLDDSYFDGANCYVADIPTDRIGFIYNNSFYLHSLGDSSYPFDVIDNYPISNIESILSGIYDLGSFENEIKSIKPQGVTDKRIEKYMEFY